MSVVFIIAEAGVNHNGSLDMALELIDVAADAGVDAVKFQTFKTEGVMSRTAPKADYQMKTTDVTESQFDMAKKLELDEEAHRRMIEHAAKRGICFLSTPFDLESVDLLAITFDLPRLKIPSGEVTNAPLLLRAARTGKPLILSTGMCTLGEVEGALGVLAFGYVGHGKSPSADAFREFYCSNEGQRALREKVALMHCTTAYPARYDEVNLRVMDTMRSAFDIPVGLSDHTPGIAVSLAAVARGAEIIEKHFTLDQNLPGPDHKASLEPSELKALVEGVRQVGAALGSVIKLPGREERSNIPIARKSLVAGRDICKGELFTEENLTVKRPGTGISPMHYWEWIGKRAVKNHLADEII